jgi:hypothetical protein
MSSSPFNASAIAAECDKLMKFTGSSKGVAALHVWAIVALSILFALMLFAFGTITQMLQHNRDFKKVCKMQGAEGEEAMFELYKFYMKFARGADPRA